MNRPGRVQVSKNPVHTSLLYRPHTVFITGEKTITVSYYFYAISEVQSGYYIFLVEIMAMADKDDNSSPEHPWSYVKAMFQIHYTTKSNI